jgi:squalene-associated FAD-dependent desaturase
MPDRYPSIYVVGGGLSGIAAAEALSHDRGRPRSVVILEARPQLGGRTSSYRESYDGRMTDTGQHLFMDGYHATRHLLKILGTEHHLTFVDPFSLYLLIPPDRLSLLEIPLDNGQAGLLSGIMGFGGISLLSRLSLLRIKGALPKRNDSVDHMDARTFLRQAGQTKEAIDRFWELLTISATNLPTDKVSASLLVSILKESLFSGAGPRTLGYNTVPLSELIVDPAQRILEKRGVDIRFKTSVNQFNVQQDRVSELVSSRENFKVGPEDHVIVAVPPWAFERLFPMERMNEPLVQNVARLSDPSPILSIHLWLRREVWIPIMTGFPENDIHWVFNKDAMTPSGQVGRTPDPSLFDFQYTGSVRQFYPTKSVSCVVSGAEKLVDRGDRDLVVSAMVTLKKIVSDLNALDLVHSRVIRERFATPVFAPGQGMYRPAASSFLSNLWIAGDLADTGLPATMEGAVRAGYQAAEEIERILERRRIGGARGSSEIQETLL